MKFGEKCKLKYKGQHDQVTGSQSLKRSLGRIRRNPSVRRPISGPLNQNFINQRDQIYVSLCRYVSVIGKYNLLRMLPQ